MRFGVSMMFTDYSASMAEVAMAAEERGFESLFAPEHTHIPISRRDPFPAGGELPRRYIHSLDPFVGLATAAAVTSTLKLGTGVCLVVQRDPIILAKEVATLDHVSNGRFLFGIGAGWNREEMSSHGTDPRTRWELMAERIEAMRVIWSSEEAEYHGTYVDFDPIWSWPKPIQQPGPPVLLGGAGERALRAVVDYADEWTPIFGRPSDFPAMFERVRRQAAERGRAPIPVSIFQAPTSPAELSALGDLGVSRAVFTLPTEDFDSVRRALDEYAEIASGL